MEMWLVFKKTSWFQYWSAFSVFTN